MQARVAGIDLALGITVLFIVAIDIFSSLTGWTGPNASYAHEIIEDLFLGLFFFVSGLRCTFILRNSHSGGLNPTRYLLSRGGVTVFLGLIIALFHDNWLLLTLGICIVISFLLIGLSNIILYSVFILITLFAITAPLTFSSPEEIALENLEWWELLTWVRYDALVPWILFFIIGMVHGRSDFLNPKFISLTRNLSLALIGIAVILHFSANDFFQASLALNNDANPRLLPFSLTVHRPLFLLAAIPMCVIFFQLLTKLSILISKTSFWHCLLRMGQYHLSAIFFGYALSYAISEWAVVTKTIAYLVSLGYIVLALLICSALKGRMKTGPIEKVLQRLYRHGSKTSA